MTMIGAEYTVPTSDFLGVSHTGASWDIGAFEFESGGVVDLWQHGVLIQIG